MRRIKDIEEMFIPSSFFPVIETQRKNGEDHHPLNIGWIGVKNNETNSQYR